MTEEYKQELRDSSIQEKLHHVQQYLGVKKDAKNSFGNYNYRTLPMILENLKPHLEATGCFVTLNDEVMNIGENNYIKATATFGDLNGDVIEATAYARESGSRKGMDDAQLTGATSSYARKYACNGLFAIDDTADNDVLAGTHPNTDVAIPNVTELQGNTNGEVKTVPKHILDLKALSCAVEFKGSGLQQKITEWIEKKNPSKTEVMEKYLKIKDQQIGIQNAKKKESK